MTQDLETIFGELGIAQYLDVFLDQGFDTWDTILDITESDLDALGVKLGHRRKLQRRIANSRGLAPDASLISPTQPSAEDARLEAHRPEPTVETRDAGPAVISKRKYRRHPKPDENAPERPPSAYVLFSNKMREDLKGRNLTFTEIAKLVGENWQSLSPVEKEPFERQAQAAKDKYNRDLAEYKKTPEYEKYTVYLQEFRAKHAHQAQDKDASKRVKLSEVGGSSYSSTDVNGTPNRTSRSGSGSESQLGSEPPPSRQQRLGSTVSMSDSPHSASVTPAPYHATVDESMGSPTTNHLDRLSSERSPTFSTSPRDMAPIPSRRSSRWSEDPRVEQSGVQRHLPSLSDVFETRNSVHNVPPVNEVNNFPYPRGRHPDSPGPPPGLMPDGRQPTLRNEQSSAGSSSSSSSLNYPRTPIEGSSLPIHALLTSKSNAPYETGQSPAIFGGCPIPVENKPPFVQYHVNHSASILSNGYHHAGASYPQSTASSHLNGAGFHAQSAPFAPVELSQGQKPDANLDGMSALLKAGEIVDRRGTR